MVMISTSLTMSNVLSRLSIEGIVTLGGAARYRVVISDGVFYMRAMLATIHTPLVEQGYIKNLTAVRITDAICYNSDGRRRFLVILQPEVMENNVALRYGEPASIERTAMRISAHDRQLQPVQPLEAHDDPSSIHRPYQQSQQQLQQHTAESSASDSITITVSSETLSFPIKLLTPSQTKWTIKARVTHKSAVNARAKSKQLPLMIDGTGYPVIALKGAVMSGIYGRCLSFPPSGTLKRNPDFPESHKLQQWSDVYGQNVVYSCFQCSIPMMSSGTWITPKVTIREAKDRQFGAGGKVDFFSTRATIAFIERDDYAYPGCPVCRKKLVQKVDGWLCEQCHQTHGRPDYNYMLLFGVEDAPGQLHLNVFDKVTSPIMDRGATELTTLRQIDPAAFQHVFEVAKDKTYDFKIMAGQTYFNVK